MDKWNEHTMEMEPEKMDRQGKAVEIRLSSLGLAGAYLGEQEIERLQAEVARLREALAALFENDYLRILSGGTWACDCGGRAKQGEAEVRHHNECPFAALSDTAAIREGENE